MDTKYYTENLDRKIKYIPPFFVKIEVYDFKNKKLKNIVISILEYILLEKIGKIKTFYGKSIYKVPEYLKGKRKVLHEYFYL